MKVIHIDTDNMDDAFEEMKKHIMAHTAKVEGDERRAFQEDCLALAGEHGLGCAAFMIATMELCCVAGIDNLREGHADIMREKLHNSLDSIYDIVLQQHPNHMPQPADTSMYDAGAGRKDDTLGISERAMREREREAVNSARAEKNRRRSEF